MIEAVPERLEGAPRQFRQRWSDEFKERAVAEAMEPGASVSAIAHRIGIHPSQLFGWRRDARAGQRSFPADPVVGLEAGPVGARAVIELVIGDIVVRAGADIHISFGTDVSPPSGFAIHLREDTDLARSPIAVIDHSFTSPIDS